MRGWMCVLVILGVSGHGICVPFSVEVTPDADAFVRSLDPTHNYGLAGGLAVSGSAAKNGSGTQMGLLDTFMQFAAADLVSKMDGNFHGHDWVIEEVVLKLTEQGKPNNPIFNRGVGSFEVRWIANDSWSEGTGMPNAPTTDGVTYQNEPSILDPLNDVSLGTFANAGTDVPLSFELGLANAFLADLEAGGLVSFFLTAASDSIGFTFNSRNIGSPRLPPTLEITADARAPIPEPATLALFAAGLVFLRPRSRRPRGQS